MQLESHFELVDTQTKTHVQPAPPIWDWIDFHHDFEKTVSMTDMLTITGKIVAVDVNSNNWGLVVSFQVWSNNEKDNTDD